MNTIQFLGISPSDLVAQIKEELIPELRKQLSKEFQPKEPEELLTRAEVCKLLDIDLSTLHRWRKDNVLRAYGVGNRVYFKRSEINDLIERNAL